MLASQKEKKENSPKTETIPMKSTQVDSFKGGESSSDIAKPLQSGSIKKPELDQMRQPGEQLKELFDKSKFEELTSGWTEVQCEHSYWKLLIFILNIILIWWIYTPIKG